MKLLIDISKDRYDEIMSMDWKNCRLLFDEEIRAIHDGKALEQEPCDDAISRQLVLKQTYNWSKDEFLRVTNPFDYLRKRINSLPSVTPQSKVGQMQEVEE